jgi:hypothetical protein
MKKKIMILAMCLGLVFSAACGSGSSGGDTPEQAAENSYLAFVSIVEYCLGDFGLEADANGYLVVKQVAETCDCPGGGTATLSADMTTVTAENCRSAGGLNFDGSVTLDDAGLVNGTMTPFGECSSLTANNVGTMTCTGTVTGTCEGETATCTVVDGTGDECDVNC